jgi:hypothetical protein
MAVGSKLALPWGHLVYIDLDIGKYIYVLVMKLWNYNATGLDRYSSLGILQVFFFKSARVKNDKPNVTSLLTLNQH